MCVGRDSAPQVHGHSHCRSDREAREICWKDDARDTAAMLPNSISLVSTFEQAKSIVYSKVCGLVFREAASGTQSLFGDASTVSFAPERRANTIWGNRCARWEFLPVSDAIRRVGCRSEGVVLRMNCGVASRKTTSCYVSALALPRPLTADLRLPNLVNIAKDTRTRICEAIPGAIWVVPLCVECPQQFTKEPGEVRCLWHRDEAFRCR
jgi:hypothetical protein